MPYSKFTLSEIINQFMKLENSIITFDKKRYYINEVESILGVLHQIINYYK